MLSRHMLLVTWLAVALGAGCSGAAEFQRAAGESEREEYRAAPGFVRVQDKTIGDVLALDLVYDGSCDRIGVLKVESVKTNFFGSETIVGTEHRERKSKVIPCRRPVKAKVAALRCGGEAVPMTINPPVQGNDYTRTNTPLSSLTEPFLLALFDGKPVMLWLDEKNFGFVRLNDENLAGLKKTAEGLAIKKCTVTQEAGCRYYLEKCTACAYKADAEAVLKQIAEQARLQAADGLDEEIRTALEAGQADSEQLRAYLAACEKLGRCTYKPQILELLELRRVFWAKLMAWIWNSIDWRISAASDSYYRCQNAVGVEVSCSSGAAINRDEFSHQRADGAARRRTDAPVTCSFSAAFDWGNTHRGTGDLRLGKKGVWTEFSEEAYLYTPMGGTIQASVACRVPLKPVLKAISFSAEQVNALFPTKYGWGDSTEVVVSQSVGEYSSFSVGGVPVELPSGPWNGGTLEDPPAPKGVYRFNPEAAQ